MNLTLWLSLALLAGEATPQHSAELIFPLNAQHNHAAGVVECPNGDLLVSWYRGEGERSSDDVAVYGARRRAGEEAWSEPFVMADTPGFPDCNTCMMIDRNGRLQLFWPLVIANSWESCITKQLTSTDYTSDGSPKWERESLVLLKPADFAPAANAELDKLVEKYKLLLTDEFRAEIAEGRKKMADKLFQRLGWQPRCKPTVLPSGRILLPLYSDTYSLSIMAISDDDGKTWYASEPLLGFGAIQPAVVRRDNGELVAYMRDNGIENRIQSAVSKDDGLTWGPVTAMEFANPGSGLDAVRLANGHWAVDLQRRTGRPQSVGGVDFRRRRKDLEVEADTWKRSQKVRFTTRRSSRERTTRFTPFTAMTVDGGESMKHAAFNEAWVQEPGEAK